MSIHSLNILVIIKWSTNFILNMYLLSKVFTLEKVHFHKVLTLVQVHFHYKHIKTVFDVIYLQVYYVDWPKEMYI